MRESSPAERFTPGLGGPGIHLEHLHRYHLAAGLAGGTVLDLGCGVGYGSRILSGSAERVVGVDLSPAAIAQARRRFASPSVEYLVGESRSLPFGAELFDRVVCFELVEHLPDPEALIGEIRRVLRPRGLLLLSTPNRIEYSERQGYRNPHHLKELDREELLELLSARFQRIEMRGQSLVAGSRVWDLDSRRVAAGETMLTAADLPAELRPPGDPMYFVAVCGSEEGLREIPSPPAGSVLLGRLAAFLEEREAEHAARGEQERRKYEAAHRAVEGQLSTYLGQIRELVEELERREEARASEAQRAAERLAEAGEVQARLGEERDRLASELPAALAEGARLRALLEGAQVEIGRLLESLQASRAEVGRLSESLQASRAEVGRLSRSVQAIEKEQETLAEDLQETRAAKEWLYEVWQGARRELEAMRSSKVGRPLWGTWQGYLALRRKLLRIARARRRAPAVAARGPGAGAALGLRRLPRLLAHPFRRAARLGGRACGLVYLSLDAARELLTAAARRRRRRAESGEPRSFEGGHRERPRRSRERRPRVLMLMPYPIYPAIHGGGVRLFNLIKRISEHCELHLVVFSGSGEDPLQRQALDPLVSSLEFHPWGPAAPRDRWGLSAPSARLFASEELERRVGHLLSRRGIDILQLEYAELGQYGLPRFARVKVALTEYDIAFRQARRRRQLGFHRRFPEGNAYGGTLADWLRLLRYELAVCRRADQIHLMSEEDARFLGAYLADGQRRLRVVANGVDTAFYEPPVSAQERRGVLFVGNFQHLPNVDAMRFLAEEIWPLVRARRPGETLSVVGAHPSEKVLGFDGRDGIRVIGRVDETRSYYHRHQVLVAPIRAGSGTRLKILEAFAAGIPVVSTTLGAEGIEAAAGSDLLIADSAREIAQSILRLLENGALGVRVAEQARRLAVERYDWDQSARAMLRGWEDLLGAGEARERARVEHLAEASSGGSEESVVEAGPAARVGQERIDVSVVIPTFRGGPMFERCLEALSRQSIGRKVELICVDSGSTDAELEAMRRHGARRIEIDKSQFNHGLSRDLGAARARGRVLVFINQDAVPVDESWLESLTEPLFEEPVCAAVQGGIREVQEGERRFFWDTGGDRFYFTRETSRWMERYFGIGFSTVNAAMRRDVWLRHPFGDAPIMEDKKWQKEVVSAGLSICVRPDAAVLHSHDYGLRSIWRRCESEGFGWRLLGERYSVFDLAADLVKPRLWVDLGRGLAARRVRTAAELLFPWVRPLALWWGNRLSRGVKL